MTTPAHEAILDYVQNILGDALVSVKSEHGELTLELSRDKWRSCSYTLRDDPRLGFEQLIDLCGVDYLTYGEQERRAPRFAVVAHLLSLRHNRRVRLRTFLDDEAPVVASLTEVWNSAEWYEREAFDLFGFIFEGHKDLRRLLTDYGFVGHPFRKDFPISGRVEMRYDPDKRRVVYEPVSIEPRVLVPRVIREEGYGGRDS
ncbi:NADH-quinone oxidoreductase subunit C [Acidiferrobacter sp.]|jgi:NADH-quinone oxidoreductase subunit C|uniref:NADH-quinone oxidoreductase subunit C n=1 Tax=Acidiferrobacter sp. TaxID=1872107 RepID=UPI00261E5BAF|nr:NADH-quinone oxidoreductase subunit C [Acidiferrobacter sp.]